MFKQFLTYRNLQKNTKATAINYMVWVLVLTIIVISVCLPILTALIAAAGLTGIPGMVVSYFGTFLVLALLYFVAFGLTG